MSYAVVTWKKEFGSETVSRDALGAVSVREAGVMSSFLSFTPRHLAVTMGEILTMLRTLTLVGLACATASSLQPASAQSLPTAKQIPLAIATEAVSEAVAVCEKSGYRVTATLVDAEGLVKAVAKGDNAPP